MKPAYTITRGWTIKGIEYFKSRVYILGHKNGKEKIFIFTKKGILLYKVKL